MLTKPEACKGCPFYGDGKGFVPDEIKDDKEVFVYAQNPGEDEEKGRKVTGYDGKRVVYEQHPQAPMLGKTGYAMENTYLKMAGYERKRISLGNALRCRHNHSNNLPPLRSTEVKTAIQHCHTAHFRLPNATKLIIAQGDYALYALTKETNVSDWRGYVLPFAPNGYTYTSVYTPSTAPIGSTLPVLAVNHIAALFRAPNLGLLARADWGKIPLILDGTWPKAPPQIYTRQNMMWPHLFAFDTEFIPTKKLGDVKHLIRYSMAHRDVTDHTNIVCHVVERDDITYGGPLVMGKPKIITQNALADLAFFEMISGLTEKGYDLEDIMHMHAVLWAGFPHDLNTFGSLYGSINRWKHLEKSSPIVYSGMDAVVTLEAFERLDREMKYDQRSRDVYYEIQLKLVRVIQHSAQETGIKVNKEKALTYWKDYSMDVDRLREQGQSVVGWPINVGSNEQTARQLYEVERIQDKVFPPVAKKPVRKSDE